LYTPNRFIKIVQGTELAHSVKILQLINYNLINEWKTTADGIDKIFHS